MPELPEVEIVKRELEQKIIGDNIHKVYQSEKSLRIPMPDLSRLLGSKILSIKRRNKYIILETEHNWCLIHLGMTGRLTIEDNEALKKHTHYRLQLRDNLFIKYEDARRFGIIAIYSKDSYKDYNSIELLSKLGVEPFSKEFTPAYIKSILTGKNAVIKKLLMDSNLICGVGNIYASEILFLCGINPLEPSKNLTDKDIKNLHRHIIAVLEKSISLGGSSISDYVHTNGVKGEMQNFYNVYGRFDEECKVCKTHIERVNIGGRNSYYCPKCQPLRLLN